MSAPETFRIHVVQDRPKTGMWHCGPNPCWVTVTHLPTLTQARAYGSQYRAREAAMLCCRMMIEETRCEDDTCSFPESLAEGSEVQP